jgi:hypothetical protein
MIWWLVDNANLILLVLALGLLILTPLYWQTRKRKYVLPLGVLLCGMGLLWLLSRVVVTDRKQIEINVRAMADATLERRVNLLRTYLGQDFEYAGINRAEIADKVIQAARHFKVTDYYIWDFTIEELFRPQGKAKASFSLRVNSGEEIIFMGLCRTTFVLENERWCLQSIQVYNRFADTDRPFIIPLH